MKQLVCAKDVETLKEEGKTELYIDEDAIVTPSARDAADSLGVTFSYKKGCGGGNAPSGSQDIDSNQIYMVLKALLDKGLLDKGLLDGGFQPYDSQSHPNGLKVVRGNSVKMDVFDTGNPKATAYFQEWGGKDESHISAGFLVIDHSGFEWELTYEEIDYVIEGTLTVTIDGKTYTAHAGDVLFVPSGSKVIWGSPDKARIFYATYPANWADLL